MRLILVLGPLVLSAALSATDAPLPEVADPYGLGRRLALIELLRDDYGLTIDPGVTETALDDLYRRELAKRAVAPAAVAEPERALVEVSPSPAPRPEPAVADAVPDAATVAPSRSSAIVRDRSVDIPGDGWCLTIADLGWAAFAPRRTAQGAVGETATSDGLLLTLFVEAPAGPGRTHQDVHDHYWPLAARNPLIDAATVTVERDPRFVAVRYAMAGVPQANFYFCYHDRWVDVHVSDTRARPDAGFGEFARHLGYRPGAAPPAAAPTSVAVGGVRLTWKAADGWRVAAREGGPQGIAALRCAVDGGLLQVSLMPESIAPEPPDTDAKLKALAEAAVGHYAAGSVEGETRLVPITGGAGSGYAATFTDASLVDLAPRPGQYRVVTAGVYRVGGVDAAFTLLSDQADGAVAEAGLDLLRSLAPTAAP